MDVRAFIERLRAGRHYRDQIADIRVIEPRAAEYRDPQVPLPPALRTLLKNEGIAQLFSHQATAYDAVRAGQDVVICTGTASGKSLCYHLPVLAALAEQPESRALYLFPAKALAYDQLGSLQRMVAEGGLADVARPACYDGDTPSHKRPGIRRSASILLSNPDMLHQSILPYHAKWAPFLARLKYVVLDEIHTYRGIFGSHVAGVVRRLQRLCQHYGSSPQFICCSATLGNPRELAQRLIGRKPLLIKQDGSPQGRRWIVLWNPPWMETATRVTRRSGNAEAQELMQALVEDGAGTITFCKARVVAELIYKYLCQSLQRRRPDLVRRVRPYRGGYLPLERREIEQKLFTGELLGVCSTSALELGIDVGSLDASIIVGFPGTFCSLWQQAGRAGRRQDESLSIFVAYDDPVDQYLMRNTDFIFRQPLEHAIIDPDNPHILASQLGCAAFELPLSPAELATFSHVGTAVADALKTDGKLRLTGADAAPANSAAAGVSGAVASTASVATGAPPAVDLRADRSVPTGASSAAQSPSRSAGPPAPATLPPSSAARYYWSSADFPAAQTSLRTISNATFAIVDTTDNRNTVIGQVDSISAPELIYPEAVYIHQGEEYIVRELDWPARLARVQRLDADYYTQPVIADECRLGAERLHGTCRGGQRFFGDVTVKWQTIAFQKFKLYTQEMIGQTMLDLPAQQIDTTGLWLQPPPLALAATRDAGYKVYEAMSGVRNLLMVSLPPLAMCDRYDIGGIVNSSQLGVSTIILYDRYEGGVGYARHGYECCDDLLKLAFELVRGCRCESGCPGCVAPPNLRIPIHHDPDLGHGYAIPDKAATMQLLSTWTG